MSTVQVTPEEIFEQIKDLPPESLKELAYFIEFLRFKLKEREGEKKTPYRIVAKLEGLWEGEEFTAEEITRLRRELWAGFGEREL
ncbi:MAG: hypothetical protein ACUVV0_15510 [Anaerolineae bacterium]